MFHGKQQAQKEKTLYFWNTKCRKRESEKLQLNDKGNNFENNC